MIFFLLKGTLTSRVRWHTNQPDVIEINGIFSEAGIEYDEHDSISVRLKALNPGTAKIQAEFTTTSGSHLSFIEITVFKLLELEQPRHISSDVIIVPPRSQINLKANLPDARFQVADGTNGGLKVSADGVLRTSDHIGRDLIIVSVNVNEQKLIFKLVQQNVNNATLFHAFFRLPQTISSYPFQLKQRISIMY